VAPAPYGVGATVMSEVWRHDRARWRMAVRFQPGGPRPRPAFGAERRHPATGTRGRRFSMPAASSCPAATDRT